jgi:hypothetical protein
MRTHYAATASDTSDTVYWKTDQTGDWSDAADWSTGAVPGAGDTVVISARSITTGYQVSISTPEAAAVLRLNSNSLGTIYDTSILTIGHLLKVDGGRLIVGQGGTITGGDIQVSSSATFLVVEGTLTNLRVEGTVEADGLTIAAGTKFSGIDSSGVATIVAAGTPGITVLGADVLNHVNIGLGGTLTSEASGSEAGNLVIGGDAVINQASSM